MNLRRLACVPQAAREDGAGEAEARPAADGGAHHLAPPVHRPLTETGHGTGVAVRQRQIPRALTGTHPALRPHGTRVCLGLPHSQWVHVTSRLPCPWEGAGLPSPPAAGPQCQHKQEQSVSPGAGGTRRAIAPGDGMCGQWLPSTWREALPGGGLRACPIGCLRCGVMHAQELRGHYDPPHGGCAVRPQVCAEVVLMVSRRPVGGAGDAGGPPQFGEARARWSCCRD